MNPEEEENERSHVEINQNNVKSILMDGFEYTFCRMMGAAQKWKCSNSSCYAYFKVLDNQILPVVMAHTHKCSSEQVESPIQQGAVSEAKTPSKVRRVHNQDTSEAAKDAENEKLPSSVKKAMLSSWKTARKLNGDASSPSGFASSSTSSDKSGSSTVQSPVKSPNPSQMGSPPTPPLSYDSQHDSNPSSPLPIIDFVDKSVSFTSDLGACFLNPSSVSHQKPLQPKNLSKVNKYNEFQSAIMKLDGTEFGFAVTSLLSELPSKVAEDARYEIATLLYGAVEEQSKLKNSSK